MATVSIVTPAYNAQNSIERAIKSVLGQTFSDIEHIVVDDGSTDETGAICDALAKCDERLKVIHIKNGGVSNARNTALDIATGKYIAFCDSDDFFEDTFVEKMVKVTEKYKCDLAVSTVFVDWDDSSKNYIQKVNFKGLYENDGIAELLKGFFDVNLMGLWNKLFLRETIEKFHIRMDTDVSNSEDAAFVLKYMNEINSVYLFDEPLYHYTQQNQNSLTHKFNTDEVKGTELVIELIKKWFKKRNCYSDEIKNYCERRLADIKCGFVYKAFMDSRVSKDVRKKVFKESTADKKERTLMKNGGISNRIIATGCYPLANLYFLIIKKMGR